LLRAELIVISDSLDEKTLDTMFTKKASTVEEAIEMALKKQGKDAKILLIRNATDIVPTTKA
jgi:nickel-dependent lactate racemase